MTEQERALKELRAVDIIEALEWAVKSAHDRAYHDFDPTTGHDRLVLGGMAHALLRNRLDRVFRTKDYAIPLGQVDAQATENIGEPAGAEEPAVDSLLDGLSDGDLAAMPRQLAGVATRADLNGSPAWRHGRYRWFTTSFDYGEIDKIRWSEKGVTKQRIAARMGTNSADQLVMPSNVLLDDEEFQTLAEVQAQAAEDDELQVMLAHAIDPHTGLSELYIGRPRLNAEGGPCWVWRERLKGRGEDPFGQRVHGPAPRPQDPDSVSDAPVRLRPSAAENAANRNSKES